MSLEGLSSLIQLESARLEGARQVTQSSQSVNQTAQQSGLQTASSKQNMWLQQIDAKMNKEMAEADVRRLESKLQRDRKAEKLAALVAQVVTVGSLASNMWNFGVNDLMKKDQKLGDIPDYLQAKPLDVSNKAGALNLQWANKPGSTDRIGYVTQSEMPGQTRDPNVPETVYQVSQNGDGTVANSRAATVSQADIRQIIGEDAFGQLSKSGKPITFSSLSDSQKEKVMQNLGHDVARGEAENVVEAFKIASVSSHGAGQEVLGNTKSLSAVNLDNARKIAKTLDITSANSSDAERVSKISDITKIVQSVDPEAAKKINSNQKSEEILKIINSATTPKIEQRQIPSPGEIDTFKRSLSNKEANVRTMSKPEYVKEKLDKTKLDKAASDKVPVEEVKLDKAIVDKILSTPIERVQIEVDGKNMTFDLDADWMKKNGFGELSGMSFSEIYKNANVVASEILSKKVQEGSVSIMKTEEADSFRSNVSNVGSKAMPTVSALIDNLKGRGALDKNYNTGALNHVLSGASTVGKGLMNVMVQTAQESVPYFQAYMKAKENADNTEEQLNAARAKLEAANRKLKSIEQQINDFALRGA
jgi:hypothetical protein